MTTTDYYVSKTNLQYVINWIKKYLATKDDLDLKVNAVAGKELSDNNLTDELLAKINASGTSNFSGKYEDLTNKPDINQMAKDVLTNSTVAADVAAIKADYITTENMASAIAQAGHVSVQFVDTLPTDPKPNIIYCSPQTTGDENDNWDEWIFKNSKWEKIGNRKVDFTGVWSKEELKPISNEELGAMLDA